MYCQTCGKEFAVQSSFCDQCGTKTAEEVKPVAASHAATQGAQLLTPSAAGVAVSGVTQTAQQPLTKTITKTSYKGKYWLIGGSVALLVYQLFCISQALSGLFRVLALSNVPIETTVFSVMRAMGSFPPLAVFIVALVHCNSRKAARRCIPLTAIYAVLLIAVLMIVATSGMRPSNGLLYYFGATFITNVSLSTGSSFISAILTLLQLGALSIIVIGACKNLLEPTVTTSVAALPQSALTNVVMPDGTVATVAKPPNADDSSSIGFAILGFFVPLVGLILYLVWKSEYPLRARSAGKGALISVILEVATLILITVVFIAILFAAAPTQTFR